MYTAYTLYTHGAHNISLIYHVRSIHTLHTSAMCTLLLTIYIVSYILFSGIYLSSA